MAGQVRTSVKHPALGTLAAMSEQTQAPDERIARQQEEILRLRDLLVGKDAELGALRGRVAELEAGTGRLLNAAARLRARVPGFVRTAVSGLRKRRG